MMSEAGASSSAPHWRGANPATLLVDEGAGVLLAAAAGDVAAATGRHPGYSSRTQAATVVAYHVIGRGGVVRSELAAELAELDASGETVYVDTSRPFRAWLDSAAAGAPVATGIPDAEPATRVVPLGVWFRTDADGLVRSAMEAVRVENHDGPTIAAAVAAAGAVAGSSLAMAGRDLVFAAGETAARAVAAMEAEDYRFARVGDAADVAAALDELKLEVGAGYDRAREALTGRVPTELTPVLAAIILSADAGADPVLTIEEAANLGGPDAAFLVGAMVGARIGLRRWPWAVPNETWFAEIGRRLVGHVGELRDLPVPYAVELRMQSAIRTDPRSEI